MTEQEQRFSRATSSRYRARQKSWREARREVFETIGQADEVEATTETQGGQE